MNPEKQIILFDGVCNLCSFWVRFVLKRDKHKHFEFVALQSEKGQHLLAQYRIPGEMDSVVLLQDKRVSLESDAVIQIAKGLNFPWNLLSGIKILPKKWRDRLYRWIAKNRYGWFGKKDHCSYKIS